MRATIDYGIDLGTTNSLIAVQRGATKEVLPEEGTLLVPSVVHIAADGKRTVGREAVKLRRDDPSNTSAEFKRLMGTAETIDFPASRTSLTPIELSAEVVRHLVARANRIDQRSLSAAVITIPAMFQLPQCEATREAARLAGLVSAPLLQEPIAAAIASVGQADLREGYWLVYDLGGGTFDVSLVRSRAGRLQVLDHDGDNHLGGKDFDRVVSRRAADAVRAEGKLGQFRRSDPALSGAFDCLKHEAERVRLALSSADQAEFFIEELARTPQGEPVGVRFTLHREELESMIQPSILRTAELCQRMLERNRLRASELRRLVLVGGPTLTPCLPAMLEEKLGTEARHYVDPSCAVAIGAAVYASTQQIGGRKSQPAPGALDVELSFEAMTNDPKPMLAGQIVGDRPEGDWTVRVTSGSRLETLPVRKDGAFLGRIELEPATLNVFQLTVLRDGTEVPGLDGGFSILHGTTIAKPILPQSVGVLLANNTVRWYLKKGVVLPARHIVSHSTTVELRRGQSGEAIHVPLIQGENSRGDRNAVVGVLRIQAENLPKNLPIGSEVIVTLSVDEHSTTQAEAYIPLLDRTFNEVAKFGIEVKSPEAIQQDLDQQRKRLAELEKLADESEAGDGAIDSRVRMIEELLEEGGADEREQADQLLRGVTGLIDSLEVRDKQASLSQSFAQKHANICAMLEKSDADRIRQLNALTAEFQNALQQGDTRLAESKLKTIGDLEWSLWQEQPGFWPNLFEHLSAQVLQGPNAAEGRVPIDEGKVAMAKNDLRGVATACMLLIKLLPEQSAAALPATLRSHIA